eukprot:sb/3461241/
MVEQAARKRGFGTLRRSASFGKSKNANNSTLNKSLGSAGLDLATVESEYIKNLQQQVYFLELEANFLREQAQKAELLSKHSAADEATKWRRRLKDVEIEQDSLKSEIRRKEIEAEAADLERRQYVKELKSLKHTAAAEKDHLIDEISSLRNKLDNSCLNEKKLQIQLETAEDTKTATLGKALDVESRLAVVRDQLDRTLNTNKELRTDLAEKRLEIKQFKMQLGDLESKYLTQATELKEAAISDMRGRLADMRVRMRELEVTSELDKSLKEKALEDSTNSSKTCAMLREEIYDLKAQLNKERDLYEKQSIKRSIDTDEIASLKYKNSKIQEDISGLNDSLAKEKKKSKSYLSKLADTDADLSTNRANETMLRNKLADVELTKDSKSQEVSSLRKDKNLLLDQVIDLQSKLDLKNSEVSSLLVEIDYLKSKVSELASEARLNKSLETRSTLRRSASFGKSKNANNSTLNKSLGSAGLDLATVESEYIKNLQQQVYFLELEANFLREQAQKAELLSKHSAADEATKWRRRLKDVEIEQDSLKSEIRRKEIEAEAADLERRQYVKELKSLKHTAAAEKDHLIDEISSLRNKLDNSCLNEKKLQIQLETAEDTKTATLGKALDVESRLAVVRDQLDRTLNTNKELRTDLAEKRLEIKQFKMQLGDLESKYLTQATELKEAAISDMRGRLEKALEDSTYSSKTCAMLREEICDLKAQLNKERDLYEKQSIKRSIDTDEIASLKYKNSKFQEDISGLNDTLAKEKKKSKSYLSKLADTDADLSTNRANETMLRNKLADVELTKDSKSQEVSSLRKDKNLLLDQVIDLQSKLDLKNSEVSSLLVEIDYLKSKVSELASEARLNKSLETRRWEDIENMAEKIHRSPSPRPRSPYNTADSPSFSLLSTVVMPFLYIGNLGVDYDQDSVEKDFGFYGKIREAWHWPTFGYCFFEYDNHRDADDALKELNGGKSVDGGWRFSLPDVQGSTFPHGQQQMINVMCVIDMDTSLETDPDIGMPAPSSSSRRSPPPCRHSRLRVDRIRIGQVCWSKTIAEDEEIRLKCNTTGYPEELLQWSQNGDPITSPLLMWRGAGEVMIERAVMEDSGEYRCGIPQEGGVVEWSEPMKVDIKVGHHGVPEGRSTSTEPSSKTAHWLSGFIYIYTASANITPAPRDHLHGEICTVLLRERADIEVAGYMQEKCSRSVFTP